MPDVSLDEMQLAPRVANLISGSGLNLKTGKDVANAYITGELNNIRGFGNKARMDVENWINSNKNNKNDTKNQKIQGIEEIKP